MRISLIHAILVFLTILHPVSVLANVVGEDLAGVFVHDVDAVKAEFSEPLPEKQTAEGNWAVVAASFLDIVAGLLDMLKDEFVKSFGIIKAKLTRAIFITGEIFSCLEHAPQANVLWSQSDYKPSWFID